MNKMNLNSATLKIIQIHFFHVLSHISLFKVCVWVLSKTQQKATTSKNKQPKKLVLSQLSEYLNTYISGQNIACLNKLRSSPKFSACDHTTTAATIQYTTIQLYCLCVEKFSFWLVIYIKTFNTVNNKTSTTQ